MRACMQNNMARHASWQELLGPPSPASHIVQLYDSDDFLVAAVSLFAAEGLQRGEAVLLSGSPQHLRDLRSTLRKQGVDADAAVRNGHLSLMDAHQGAHASLAGARLASALADSRYTGLRWWGEVSNILLQHGDKKAALAAEDLGDEAAHEHGLTLLCSYLCDRFDPQSYDDTLHTICCKHSHVIPAADYVQHRLAVNYAIEEVIGEVRGPLLQSLLSWKGLPCELPSSQALLFWVREAMPERFAEVLARARAYQLSRPSMEAA